MPSPIRTGEITIRTAQPSDAAAITEIHLAARKVTMPYLPTLHTDEETLAWITDVVLPHHQVWVAVEPAGAQVLGYAVLDGDLLDALYLRPEVRRRGIGSALLAKVREAHPGPLSLYVFQRNVEAIAFYTAHGFVRTATGDGSGNEENEPDVTYALG